MGLLGILQISAEKLVYTWLRLKEFKHAAVTSVPRKKKRLPGSCSFKPKWVEYILSKTDSVFIFLFASTFVNRIDCDSRGLERHTSCVAKGKPCHEGTGCCCMLGLFFA